MGKIKRIDYNMQCRNSKGVLLRGVVLKMSMLYNEDNISSAEALEKLRNNTAGKDTRILCMTQKRADNLIGSQLGSSTAIGSVYYTAKPKDLDGNLLEGIEPLPMAMLFNEAVIPFQEALALLRSGRAEKDERVLCIPKVKADALKGKSPVTANKGTV